MFVREWEEAKTYLIPPLNSFTIPIIADIFVFFKIRRTWKLSSSHRRRAVTGTFCKSVFLACQSEHFDKRGKQSCSSYRQIFWQWPLEFHCNIKFPLFFVQIPLNFPFLVLFLPTFLILSITQACASKHVAIIIETGLVIAAAAGTEENHGSGKQEGRQENKIVIPNLWWICGRILL